MLGGTEINWAGQVKNFAITGDKGPPLLIFCEGDSLKEGSFLSIGIQKNIKKAVPMDKDNNILPL